MIPYETNKFGQEGGNQFMATGSIREPGAVCLTRPLKQMRKTKEMVDMIPTNEI